VKILVLAISALNLFLGTRCLLNVVGVLQTSKYAPATTALFAVLFLGFAAASIWFAFWGGNLKLALWLSVGPWALALVVLFLTMILSSHR
jgi:hypothetical protein